MIVDRDKAAGEALAAEVGKGCVLVHAELARAEDCAHAVEQAVAKFGRLDGLVNCAGISQPYDSISIPPADWGRMVEVQLNGAFYVAQACAKRMWNAGGAIVFITSTNAEAAFPRRAAYCSKCRMAGKKNV